MTFRNLGFGLGYRAKHHEDILSNPGRSQWFEAISESYMGIRGQGFGSRLRRLQRIRENYPVVLHGVSMSIGSVDPLHWGYLQRLGELIERIEPAWVSDHLCWTGVGEINHHDLLPLPYTKETIDHVVERIQTVQEFLGRPMMFENVSSYIEFTHSQMSEWEFVSEIVKRSGCGLLLDVNNIYVSAINHGFDPMTYLNNLPLDKVGQLHLAGHANKGDFIIDTHDEDVSDPVWDLFRKAWKLTGPVSVMIERDENIPAYLDLVGELDKARRMTTPLTEVKIRENSRSQEFASLV